MSFKNCNSDFSGLKLNINNPLDDSDSDMTLEPEMTSKP
jgi:hypothetical protein